MISRTKGRNRFLMGVLAASMMLVTACGGGNQSTTGGTDKPAEQPAASPAQNENKAPIKIGIVTSKTGVLEAYGNQMLNGFELGIDYATDGKREIDGRKIEIVVEDTQTKPDIAVQKATKLLEEDNVDVLVGSASSGDTLAVLPLVEEFNKVMVVEPAVADSITGSEWNRHIFRTARNSSQDAAAGAAAIAKPGVKIATLAPDYAFGRDGTAAFVKEAKELGAEIVLEEYADPNATDFTANVQKIIEAKPDYVFVIWAGANAPWKNLIDMKLPEKGIKISTGAPDIAALKTMGNLEGMEGFSVYYNELPNNPINTWLVEEHKKRFNSVPDLFTAGGMSAAISIVEGIKKAGSTDADQLIAAMEGMEFDTPKGKMKFRAEDHQALQTLYAIKLEKKEGYDHLVPTLLRELSPEETEPPVLNK
ncbi:substrate-binding domain-containing protein [Ammoniphilus sp. 3BR4]|uniref:substrate-binding domain-containing protein n=1 Tax=Ammoniphilus sp. 3BR4 TaxID=3158265 RepID=UPI003466D62C